MEDTGWQKKSDMKMQNGQVVTAEDGKPLGDLIEDVILYTADHRISA